MYCQFQDLYVPEIQKRISGQLKAYNRNYGNGAIYFEQYRDILMNDPAFLRYLCLSLATKLVGAVTSTRKLPLKERVAACIDHADPVQPITNIASLATSFHGSSRQLLRVLGCFCSTRSLKK